MFEYNALHELITSLDGKYFPVKDDVFYALQVGTQYDTGEETVFIEFSLVRHAEPRHDQATLIAGRDFRRRVRANPLKHLKFHISLDNTEKDETHSNFSEGYKIIIENLIKHRVKLFKVVRPGIEIAKITPSQAGKDFTVYCRNNPDYQLQHWLGILQDIHTALTEANIQPGIQPILEKSPFDLDRADQFIPGTSFITYRVENGLDPTRGFLQLTGHQADKPQKAVEDSDDRKNLSFRLN